MKDIWHSVFQFIDYNRWLVVSLLLMGIVGCSVGYLAPKTTSIIDPGRRVTMAELEREIAFAQSDILKREAALIADAEALNRSVASAVGELEDKLEMRRTIISTVGALGEGLATGETTPAGAINAIVSLMLLGSTGGLAMDNLRKSKIIASRKEGANSPAG